MEKKSQNFYFILCCNKHLSRKIFWNRDHKNKQTKLFIYILFENKNFHPYFTISDSHHGNVSNKLALDENIIVLILCDLYSYEKFF